MGWRFFVVLPALLLACTKQNPKSCRDGVCNDPSLPYCDVGGELSGTPFTCVAGDCTAGTFAACRGDTAITCNAGGTNYDDVQCELGCDAASGGCRLCNPNETACTNGTLATCDAAGKVVSSEKCALGCFEDQPRCRDIDPSNGLGRFLDMVPDPVDLDLTAGLAGITTSNGEVVVVGGPTISVPNFLVTAPVGGASIRVFVVRSLHAGNVDINGSNSAGVFDPQPAIAFVASGDIVIDGVVSVGGPTFRSDSASPGAVIFDSCRGATGFDNTFGSCDASSGAGGGGHATAGAKGGDVDVVLLGGAGGGASGSPELVPLRGGCSSTDFVSGGGAIQLSSQTAITVNGVIDVRGGTENVQNFVITAGGAGGGVLLEAPSVTLGPQAKLLATGGAGSSASGAATLSDTAAPSIGAPCSPPSPLCGAGGNGAAPGVAATPGKNSGLDSSKPRATAGGGGGGLGYVRINTADGSYAKANTTIEAASLSTGTVKTR